MQHAKRVTPAELLLNPFRQSNEQDTVPKLQPEDRALVFGEASTKGEVSSSGDATSQREHTTKDEEGTEKEKYFVTWLKALERTKDISLEDQLDAYMDDVAGSSFLNKK